MAALLAQLECHSISTADWYQAGVCYSRGLLQAYRGARPVGQHAAVGARVLHGGPAEHRTAALQPSGGPRVRGRTGEAYYESSFLRWKATVHALNFLRDLLNEDLFPLIVFVTEQFVCGGLVAQTIN